MFRFTPIVAQVGALEFPYYNAGEYYPITEFHPVTPDVQVTTAIMCKTKAGEKIQVEKEIEKFNVDTMEIEKTKITVEEEGEPTFQPLHEFFSEFAADIAEKKSKGLIKNAPGTPFKKTWPQHFPKLQFLGAGGFGVVFGIECEGTKLAVKIQAREARIGNCGYKRIGEDVNYRGCPVGDAEHYVNETVGVNPNFFVNYGAYFSATEILMLQPFMDKELTGWYELASVPAEKFREPGALQNMSTQLFAGLRDVHALGLGHNDIKPENVWYNPEKKDLLIGDWGSVSLASAPAAFFSMNNIPITEKTETLRKRFNINVEKANLSGGRQSWDIYMAALTLWGVIAQQSETMYNGVRKDMARGSTRETDIEAAWVRNKNIRHFAFFHPMGFQMENGLAPLYPMMISMRGASAEDMLKIMTPHNAADRKKGALDASQWDFEDMMRTYLATLYNKADTPTATAFLRKLEETLNQEFFSNLTEEGAFLASYILPAALSVDWSIRPSASDMVRGLEQYYANGECDVVGAAKALPAPLETDANGKFLENEENKTGKESTNNTTSIAAIVIVIAVLIAAVVVVSRRKAAEDVAAAEEEQC